MNKYLTGQARRGSRSSSFRNGKGKVRSGLVPPPSLMVL